MGIPKTIISIRLRLDEIIVTNLVAVFINVFF